MILVYLGTFWVKHLPCRTQINNMVFLFWSLPQAPNHQVYISLSSAISSVPDVQVARGKAGHCIQQEPPKWVSSRINRMAHHTGANETSQTMDLEYRTREKAGRPSHRWSKCTFTSAKASTKHLQWKVFGWPQLLTQNFKAHRKPRMSMDARTLPDRQPT